MDEKIAKGVEIIRQGGELCAELADMIQEKGIEKMRKEKLVKFTEFKINRAWMSPKPRQGCFKPC